MIMDNVKLSYNERLERIELLEKQNKELREKIKKLELMIENGLGFEDMKNDITNP